MSYVARRTISPDLINSDLSWKVRLCVLWNESVVCRLLSSRNFMRVSCQIVLIELVIKRSSSFFCATIYVVPDFLHYFLRFDQSSTALCRYRTNTKMIFTLSKDTIRRITGIRVNYSARKLNPRDYLETDSNWNIIVATISLKFIGIVVFF